MQVDHILYIAKRWWGETLEKSLYTCIWIEKLWEIE